jgi:hypothetical protein
MVLEIEAWFVGGVIEIETVDQDITHVFVPEAWCFWMSLEVLEYQYDMAFGDGFAAKVCGPPFAEVVFYMHVEGFRRWWGFGEGIGDITPKVSARVTIFPWHVSPLHVLHDFSIDSRVRGSSSKKYVHTQGSMTQSRSYEGHGHGSLNMPCFSYLLSSWDHSLGDLQDNFGRAMPLRMARASDSSKMGGHVRGSVQIVSPVLIT